jgi:hypothetical protein
MLDSRGKWIQMAPLLEKQQGPEAVFFCAGKVYILGGTHPGQSPTGYTIGQPACGCLMIWNPFNNQWRPGLACPNPRVLLSVVACNDKLYTIGGMDRIECGFEQSDCAVYNPKTGVWSRIPSLPNNGKGLVHEQDAQYCHSMGAVAVGNRIYVLGGQHDDHLATARVLIYDTIRNKWFHGAPMPERRFHPECHVVGNDIFVFAGQAGFDEETNTTWKYSTETNTWTILANAPKKHNDIMVPSGKGKDLCFVSVGCLEPNKAGELKYHVASDSWEMGGAGLPGIPQAHMYGCGVCTAWF